MKNTKKGRKMIKKQKRTNLVMFTNSKGNVTVEYAIDGIKKPMGVSSFKLTEQLPDKLKQYLPSPEELAKLKRKKEN
ncbi:MAG: DUF1016 domain-containing protein [Gammaproteobacteria bacterium]|nr:DUF1016 domain-containing protein [Gammaproteobacteria bacterium]